MNPDQKPDKAVLKPEGGLPGLVVIVLLALGSVGFLVIASLVAIAKSIAKLIHGGSIDF